MNQRVRPSGVVGEMSAEAFGTMGRCRCGADGQKVSRSDDRTTMEGGVFERPANQALESTDALLLASQS